MANAAITLTSPMHTNSIKQTRPSEGFHQLLTT